MARRVLDIGGMTAISTTAHAPDRDWLLFPLFLLFLPLILLKKLGGRP